MIKEVTKDVRKINRVCSNRLQNGRATPWVQVGNMRFRVTKARTKQDVLQVQCAITDRSWIPVTGVLLETL